MILISSKFQVNPWISSRDLSILLYLWILEICCRFVTCRTPVFFGPIFQVLPSVSHFFRHIRGYVSRGCVRKYAVPTGGQAVRIGMPAMYSVTHSRMSPAPDRIYCIYDRVVDGTSSTTSTTQVLT